MNATVSLWLRFVFILKFPSVFLFLSVLLAVSVQQYCGRCLQGLLCPYQPKVQESWNKIGLMLTFNSSRVKASDVGIEAHKGRSSVEVVSVSASAPRAAAKADEEVEEEVEKEEEEITRKRRNGLSTDQDQPQQSRLSNVFVPDDVVEAEEDEGEDIWEGQDYEYEEDDLFLSRDGADIDIGKLNLEERIKVNILIFRK